jgi:hypothetical protein
VKSKKISSKLAISFLFYFKDIEDILLLKKEKTFVPLNKTKMTNKSRRKDHFTLDLNILG